MLSFPVRHHSPRASAVLTATLDRLRPQRVLVEGPIDANGLIPAVVAEDTLPPVAILAYRTDATVGSVLWPFAAYSPEYIALRWAAKNRVEARFVDVASGVALAQHAGEGAEDRAPAAVDGDEPGDSSEEGGPAGSDHPWEAVARARGLRSFEEWWEAEVEAPDWTEADYRRVLLGWSEVARSVPDGPGPKRRDWHRARDAVMLAALQSAGDGAILVAGAAHVAAIVAGDVDLAMASSLPPPVPTEVTLVPYSFTRLAEQTGYGAGNRAPRYYQQAHDAGCDYDHASLEALSEFAGQLRLRGFTATLADVLEAYRLARTLADLRHKRQPGLDEVREAAVATMCRGDASHVDTLLWPTVVGKAVGRVTAAVARNSLQAEFWSEVIARRLPATDETERFNLRLQEPVQVSTSTFLHRLRVCEVPYGAVVSMSTGGRQVTEQEAGGRDALVRARETWEARWTPATDVALVTAIVRGDSLQAVATRMLSERLRLTTGAGDTADVLLEGVVCDCPALVGEALAACESRSVQDDDLASLARAARAFANLVSFGSSRAGIAPRDVAQRLCGATFTRALLRAPAACTGSTEAVKPALEALRVLHEVAVSRAVEAAEWHACARGLVDSATVHAGCAGLAAGLLYLGGQLAEEELGATIAFRLSGGDPEPAAAFLEGVLSVNALVLCRSRPIVAALDGWLQSIPDDRFVAMVALLRRAFSGLGATERRYLLENLLVLRQLGPHAQEARAIVDAQEKAALAAAAADVAGLLDDLDELL